MSSIESRLAAVRQLSLLTPIGRISGATSNEISVTGLGLAVPPGALLKLAGGGFAEVISITDEELKCVPYQDVTEEMLAGDVRLSALDNVRPDASWLGKRFDGIGRETAASSPDWAAPTRPSKCKVKADTPAANVARFTTGIPMIDTMLPLTVGQRIGLFAGPGVGKTTLLQHIAQRSEADAVVIALIGERAHEADQMLAQLPDDIRARSICVVSTSQDAPALRRRALHVALRAAETLRNTGRSVLLLADSLSRYADACRDTDLAAGAPMGAGGYTATLSSDIARIVERCRPANEGSITAIFTVLATNGDLQGMVPDAARATLDGHIILDPALAQQGKFPAIDLQHSVSRALPDAVDPAWMDTITKIRNMQLRARAHSDLISAGLSEVGANPTEDAIIAVVERVERILHSTDNRSAEALMRELTSCLGD
ncbi:hypothetical protein [Pontivivens insulae]|uniref:Flagellum-specific ATP synthase n=1 Tax=Pontivivens insulae TaxID=1639689 RepID=A0A2R8A9Q4_9RHOB|nr:hypothetical protein [Pontivivens insulae]RED12764.1 flagellum-specific ATP synthase [Pontivivens insulae]SPF28855.1 Flagellum-specific ATP synthase [Pontivivens insulae]